MPLPDFTVDPRTPAPSAGVPENMFVECGVLPPLLLRRGLPRRPCASRLLRLLPIACAALIFAGCAHRTTTATHPPVQAPPVPTLPPAGVPSPPSAPPPRVETQPVIPGEWTEEGVASWYGPTFDGHRTSNGEIYDMHQFTAAHRTLPFGAVVRVTNLTNGRQTEVRINDRGPFVGNRVIDLSLSAAQAIGMVGPGTASVRLEVIAGPNPRVGFFAVQVGAFLSQENAERFRAQFAARYPATMATFDSSNGTFYRVRVGRFPSENDAHQLAADLHSSQQLTTFVVRLDE